MARQMGPVKGTIVFSCEETAETHTLILEGDWVSSEDFDLGAEGNGGWNFMLTAPSVIIDELGRRYSGSFGTGGTGGPGNRVNGATKGLIVFNDAEGRAISSEYIFEPVIVTKAQLDDIMASNNTYDLHMSTHVDGLGHKFMTGQLVAT